MHRTRTIRYHEWRTAWPFKVSVDETYPLAVRLASDELLLTIGTGGEDLEEVKALLGAVVYELEDAGLEHDLALESFSTYEVGRGASGEVLVLALATPFVWTIAKLAELAVTDPAKLLENLRFWHTLFERLRGRLARADVGSMSLALIRQAALAEFSADHPEVIPDVEKLRIISDFVDAGDGWSSFNNTVVVIPSLQGDELAVYVMSPLGEVSRKMSTLPVDAEDREPDVFVLPYDELHPRDDPSVDSSMDWAHVPRPVEDDRFTAGAVEIEARRRDEADSTNDE